MTPTLRHIDLAQAGSVPLRDQPAPILDWIPVARMVIDDRYQRPLNDQNWRVIRKIAAEFSWARFGPILVAPIAGGLYSVIDGQHRVHAAALCGIESVPAMAVQIDTAEQAQAFAAINTALIRVTPHQAFRASLTAGDPISIAARDAVAAAGCELTTYNPSARLKKPGQVHCIRQVLDLARRDKAWVLTTTLTAIRAYDTRGRTGLYSDFILSPLFGAVADFSPMLPPDAITATLNRDDPYHVVERMQRLAKTEGKAAGKLARAAFRTLIQRELAARMKGAA